MLNNNKRIAKNTIMLYIRMVLLMLVNLYASRVVLKALGVEDYGLYSIVGAVVIFLGFINISMSASSQRFLSFSQGKGDFEDLSSTFSSVSIVQLIISALILIVGETLGVIYIENFLNVSPEKIPVAHIVYQFSLFSFIIKTLTVPYNASIIANEKMDVFAILSIVEALLQLVVVLVLKVLVKDKLVIYAFMVLCSVSVIQLCYRFYCAAKFKECKLRRNWKKSTIRAMFSYSGWNLLGSLSAVAIDQGINMILNSFFGVIVNAARGIAFQVSGSIASLSGNFQQALNPQIVKTFAVDERTKMHRLVMNGTRFCYYLLLVLSIPVLFNIHSLLGLWLGVIPHYAERFCKLVLINALITAFSGSLLMGAMATGNIKKYQIVVASINMLNIPVSLIALYLYPDPYITVYIMIVFSIIAFAARLTLTGRLIKMPVIGFIKDVIVPVFVTTTFSVLIVYGINRLIENANILTLILRMVLSFLGVVVAIAVLGVTHHERTLAISFIKQRMTK